MFLKQSFASEIAESMERGLREDAISKVARTEERLVKAAEYLNMAAEIFDEAGLIAQAEDITEFLEVLAGKKKNKKKKKMTSERMVENLKHKGWVFDENGASDRNCASCGGTGKDRSMASDKFKEDASEDFEDETDFSDFDKRLNNKSEQHDLLGDQDADYKFLNW